MKSPSNFERLVLEYIGSYDSNQIVTFGYLSFFEIYSHPYRGEKKVEALFFPPKKRTFGRFHGRFPHSTAKHDRSQVLSWIYHSESF